MIRNTLLQERYQAQIASSLPHRKQLWQQVIKAKISNQAGVLEAQGLEAPKLRRWSRRVRSGDPDNYEAQAAARYWPLVFPLYEEFTRDRYGDPPNHCLNYGYAVLRAIVARGLVSAGLLPALGLHHRNKYNAFCLADDIMEPYRPYVDNVVLEMYNEGEAETDRLTRDQKVRLLESMTQDVVIDGRTSPLSIAVQRTTSSLAKCYLQEATHITYPTLS